jgi:hypothetical protein
VTLRRIARSSWRGSGEPGRQGVTGFVGCFCFGQKERAYLPFWRGREIFERVCTHSNEPFSIAGADAVAMPATQPEASWPASKRVSAVKIHEIQTVVAPVTHSLFAMSSVCFSSPTAATPGRHPITGPMQLRILLPMCAWDTAASGDKKDASQAVWLAASAGLFILCNLVDTASTLRPRRPRGPQRQYKPWRKTALKWITTKWPM